jgi:thioredoxin-dependent peroxiredoxin
MKYPSVTCFFAVLFLSTLSLQADAPSNFAIESPVDGKTFTLSQHRGKVVVLHFLLKTECPVCLRHTHDYAALAAGTPDVIHIFLKPDSADEIKAWSSKIKKAGLADSPVIYRDADARLAKQFNIPDGYEFHGEVVHYPALIALGADGRELFRYVGKNNSDRMKVADFTTKLAQVSAKP